MPGNKRIPSLVGVIIGFVVTNPTSHQRLSTNQLIILHVFTGHLDHFVGFMGRDLCIVGFVHVRAIFQ